MERLAHRLILAVALLGLVAGVIRFTHARPLVEWFVTVTAIDHWHPNWPGSAAATAGVQWFGGMATSLAILLFLAGLVVIIVDRTAGDYLGLHPGITPPLGATSMVSIGPALMRDTFHKPWKSIRDGIIGALVAGGADHETAAQAVVDVEKSIDQRKMLSPEQMHTALADAAAATGLDITAPHFRVTYEIRGTDTLALSRFFTAYGYRSVADPTSTHPRRLHIAYRTNDPRSEDNLIQLLLAAARAHIVATCDHGHRPRPGQPQDTLDEATTALRRTAQTLALRGFIPPELDATPGHSGIATAEELETWAIAQIVETLAPAPLRLVENDQ